MSALITLVITRGAVHELCHFPRYYVVPLTLVIARGEFGGTAMCYVVPLTLVIARGEFGGTASVIGYDILFALPSKR